jgi:hypothetical protein
MEKENVVGKEQEIEMANENWEGEGEGKAEK